jgi:hypothetical protein
MLKTITLEMPLSFHEALQYLLEGKCLGIRPESNTNYVELFKPGWMSPASPDWMLRWSGSENDSDIQSNQYSEKWYPVIVDNHWLKKYLSPSSDF